MAIKDLAQAYRERTALMFQPTPPEPEYTCEICGSPRWEPGGNCDMFKRCLDCGNIGDEIK